MSQNCPRGAVDARVGSSINEQVRIVISAHT